MNAGRINRKRRTRSKPDPATVLFDGGTFTITQADVDAAIAEGRRRLGDEYAELLEAQPITEEEVADQDQTNLPDDNAREAGDGG